MIKVTRKHLDEITSDSYKWIKVEKHIWDEFANGNENYSDLEEHHIEETTFLINKCKQLAQYIKDNNIVL